MANTQDNCTNMESGILSKLSLHVNEITIFQWLQICIATLPFFAYFFVFIFKLGQAYYLGIPICYISIDIQDILTSAIFVVLFIFSIYEFYTFRWFVKSILHRDYRAQRRDTQKAKFDFSFLKGFLGTAFIANTFVSIYITYKYIKFGTDFIFDMAFALFHICIGILCIFTYLLIHLFEKNPKRVFERLGDELFRRVVALSAFLIVASTFFLIFSFGQLEASSGGYLVDTETNRIILQVYNSNNAIAKTITSYDANSGEAILSNSISFIGLADSPNNSISTYDEVRFSLLSAPR